MHALLQNVKQSNWWRTLKLAGARWAQEDGDQRAAAFAYYLLYLSSCAGVFGICFCAARAEVRGKVTMLDAKAGGAHASGEQVRKSPAKSDLPRTAT